MVYQPRRPERTVTYQAVQARKHSHRYHGVLAPHSPLRPAVTAYAGLPLDGPAPPATGLPGHRPTPPAPPPAEAEPKPTSPAASLWAVLLARIYAVLPLICTVCGAEMRLIAAVTEREPVQRILRHIGEPALPPPVSPARSPPEEQSYDWDQTSSEAAGGCDPSFEPPPENSSSIKPSVGRLPASDTPRRRAPQVRRRPSCAGVGSTPPEARCGRLRTPHFPRPRPAMVPQAPDLIDPSR